MEYRDDIYDGYLDRVENGWVLGWAWKPNLPNDPIRVDLYVDDGLEASTSAQLYRADLERADKGNGRHGFELALPERYRDGAVHIVRVRYGGSELDLSGSPQSVFFETPTGRKNEANSGAASTPSFRSRFGGVWTDLSNASEVIDGKAWLGWISKQEVELLKKWLSEGFVILPQAVSLDLVDELDADVEEIWSGKSSARCFVELSEDGTPVVYPAGPNFKDKRVKLLDLYWHCESARRVVFAPSVVRFLSLIFERPMVAFQSLYFRWGSRQAMHQDTAFVKVSSPLEFAASWIALEDTKEGSGELEYYIGSHRLDDYLFDGRFKWMPFKSDEHESFLTSLHQKSQAKGLRKERFLARKGDVLIWNADLVHGGCDEVAEGVTRKSIVTHYCPIDSWPIYSGDGQLSPRIQYSNAAYYSSQRRD